MIESIAPIAGGFWGEVTATVDWCEPNYEWSQYVAEPMNTVSNLSFVVMGLIGASHEYMQRSRKIFMYMYLTVASIGFGSMAFHGTLTLLGQEFDELPMVWFILGLIAVQMQDTVIIPSYKITTTTLTILYAMIYSVCHIYFRFVQVFQIHFALQIITMVITGFFQFRNIHYSEKNGYLEMDDKVKNVVTLTVTSLLIGFAFWMIDYHGCEYFATMRKNNVWHVNPHGHVLWHLFMGYSAFCLVCSFRVMDCLRSVKDFKVEYWYGLPLVYRAVNKNDDNTAADEKKEYQSKFYSCGKL